ncbi:hypothetical protein [Paenibacillus periandrae]|uniref:hypothetical protein n=1 Tax=Paenibacillus periandrae TaxID=1761741 RepID=UPI001F09E41B|nr:hypothetical protein [Paenibacillus periandrae]
MSMSTVEMIGTLQEGQVARLLMDHGRITVIRKGHGFFYKDHPYLEPEGTHLVLNIGTMEALWVLEEPTVPAYVDSGVALRTLLQDIEVQATFNDQTITVSKRTKIEELLQLSDELRIEDLWLEVKWSLSLN